MTKLRSCIHPCSKFHVRRRGAVKIRSECDKEKISPADGGGKQKWLNNKMVHVQHNITPTPTSDKAKAVVHG